MSPNTYASGLFSKPSLFTKIKLRWPLSRGSHFNIYFCLECQGNWGSLQKFHGIPFFKDRVLINPGHYVTLQIQWLHAYLKNRRFKSKHGCQTTITKIN